MAAETILIPVAKQILGKAADLTSEQIGLLWNFRPELRKFESTVSTILAVLRDAEEKQCHSHQVKDWLEKLSDIMYDADDLLDDLATEARKKVVLEATTNDDVNGARRTTTTTTCWSLVCFLFSSLPKQLSYDLKMAHAIKAIREKLDDISKDKEILHLEVHTTEEGETLPSRETDSCPPTIVVGREDDKKKIIQLLLNSNQQANISVVPIVGMGGLGKTTLAQLIFDDYQVQDHFDIKAWVYVSQSFDVKAIIGKMLRSIDRQSQAGPELDDLQAQLREKIKGKRFLFVLDDVWEETNGSWETLGKYLTVGALGSKVLVTTRSTKVAEAGGGALKSRTSTSFVEPYHLKGLSEEECWKLLMEKALPRKVSQDLQVQKIGKQILRECKGVPLAVSTIAGVLVDSRDPKTEWPSFLQKGLLSICKGGEEDPTMSTLRLSFYHLPSHMKHCFIYCKLFPKGFRLNIRQLVHIWVAQGYIESEYKGFDCFKTLWWRSFFQEVEMDELGNMLTCRMHDLMHDLVDIIAGERIVRSSSSTVLKNIPSKTRHMAIFNDVSNDMRGEDGGDGTRNASKVRTLMCSLSRIKQLKQVFYNFLHLRSLMILEEDSDSDSDENSVNLEEDSNSYGEENSVILQEDSDSDSDENSMNLEEDSNSYGEENSVILQEDSNFDGEEKSALNAIDKLKHLRYLGIDCTGMEILPDSITNLVNLQVLKLSNSSLLKELPRDIKKLVNLKHLEANPDNLEDLTHMPKGIGELKFLQTLPIFVVGKNRGSSSNDRMVGAGLDELKGLNSLCRELTLKGLANADLPIKGVYILKEKLHLQSLVLYFLDWDRHGDDGDATLGSTRDEGILEMLWPHPNLEKLMIHPGYKGVKFPNWLSGLTNLVEFSLKGCKQCEYLPSQMHQMSSLKKLTIQNCPMLEGVDNDAPNNSTTKRLTADGDYCDPSRFHCLSYLWIRNCPRLTRLPMFPTVEGELELENVSLAPFAMTLKMKMKMKRGGEDVDYLDEHGYDDTNIHHLLPPLYSSHYSFCSSSGHPLSKLTKLILQRIDDDFESLAHPISCTRLISLLELQVLRCNRVVKLPGSLCSSIYLTKICILDCGMVEYLPPLHELPSLRKLSIKDCPRLVGCWWKKKKKLLQQQHQGKNNNTNNGDDDYYYYNFDPVIEGEEKGKEDEETEEQWPHFPCLSTLEIRRCPKLTRMPLFPTVEGMLYLWETSAEALVRTMKMKVVAAPNHHHLDSHQHSATNATTTTTTTSPSSSSPLLRTALVSPLSKLTQLDLRKIKDLESLPEEGLRNLTSLQELKINECRRLASLPPAMQHLTSLQILDIQWCPLLEKRCRGRVGEDSPNISHIPRIYLG